jgi:hypothetical protein
MIECAPGLARRDVLHVHFEHRKQHRLDRAVQRHTVLRQAGRFEKRAARPVDALAQLVDQRAFVIRLQRLQLHAEFGVRSRPACR